MNDKPTGTQPLRNYKDSVFCLLFSESKRAIELYNAITGENLPPDTELTYTTLENALYIDRNNDLGFIINNRHLVLVECQSTINMNIPLRCLGYVSRTIENLIGKREIYSSKLVKFPAPEFYVFYVGQADWNIKQLKLSDAFLEGSKENSIELVVNLVNLNYNDEKEILKRSPSLMGYSKLLFYIQENLKANGGDVKAAIDDAVKQSMKEDFISDFLKNYSREVTGMLFDGISVEEFAEIRAQEAYDIGRESGINEGLTQGRDEEKLEIAKKLRILGLSEEQINEATGLTIEEINDLD